MAPHSSTLAWKIYIVETTLISHYHLNPEFTLRFTLGVVHSIDFDKCIITHIHHYSIVL